MSKKGPKMEAKWPLGAPEAPKNKFLRRSKNDEKKEAKKKRKKERFRVEPDLAGERKAQFDI